ncbi:phosphoglycerate mutase-like protein [Rhizopogon vinicolor AM-OR11-026]|uniref:Phosphoglycerate mutase-like protein n=1 Tax=Rhizopogon vinicolor AM-OR11-026 TaxID=1314800 RepID=A0A1B7N4U1_9AGAM|nr:phosphoglycerate mutase-like protein [Rhizopogon vinicolor AM-OR11-026]
MSQDTDSKLLGAVLIVRHGDRQGFYQDPETYTATATQITPLGNQEEFLLGSYLRSLYLNESSPSYIPGMSTGLFNQSQVYIQADLGGEDGVIYDSCVSLTQGLWPVTPSNNITLANGTTVTAPLGGYQYIPSEFLSMALASIQCSHRIVESVDPNLSVSLEGFTDCNTFDAHTTAFYNSSQFQEMATQSAPFLNSLPPYLDGRSVMLQNMWNIFDFMNVNNIHNSTFAQALPLTYLAQVRTLANWHEYNVFSDNGIGGIGNIAGLTLLPSILNGFADIANSTNPVKLSITAIAYKPFLSLFNMTGVAAANPSLAGIVDYAAAVAFELRQPSAGGEPVIRFNFKNGSDAAFVTYNFLNSTEDVPLSAFIDAMAPVSVNTTADWCSICANTQDRGCAALTLATEQGEAAAQPKISPVGAGFLGAGLTLAVVAFMVGTLAFLGVLTVGKFRKRRSRAAGVTAKVHDLALAKRKLSILDYYEKCNEEAMQL